MGSVHELTREGLESQLLLCHEHFRRCLRALRGEDVEPCELFCSDELGDSDDLELFYACKKVGDGLKMICNGEES